MTTVQRIAPSWFKSAAQGLAFWIGHRRTIYSQHEMSEGALAAELGNLIHAHLPDKFSLRYEQPYLKLLPRGVKVKDVTDLARADMSIWERYTPEGATRKRRTPRYVIELKKASASSARIDRDLRRLAAVSENSENVRAFLCIASEESRPKRFTNNDGFALKEEFDISGTQSVYVVTSVQKAAFLFKDRNRAHYVCLIEVLAK